MRNLLPIGRFSGLSQLSVKTLRHYDDVGLLRPAFVASDTGYRYYSATQLIEAEKISLLRGIGMPIDEIRSLLSEKSPEEVLSRLACHRKTLEDNLAAMRQSLDFLQRLMTDAKSVLTAYDVRTKHVESQLFACFEIRTSLKTISQDAPKAFQAICGKVREEGVFVAGNGVAIYPDATDFDPSNFLMLTGLPVQEAFPLENPFKMLELPAGEVAFTLHKGPYHEMNAAYSALFEWLETQNRDSLGLHYEVYFNCPESVASPSELRTEIATYVV